MNPTRIVASGGMLPLALPGSHDGTADTAVPADIVPVVALAATVIVTVEPSACSMALTTRFRMTRSMRRSSISAEARVGAKVSTLTP